jgi:folate-binding protein YgfZ
VTNNVKTLRAGQGCYAALVTAKGRMECDLNIWCLDDELLLDLEPGLGKTVAARCEKYVIADDVQLTDVSSDYGLLAVLGPRSGEVIKALQLVIPSEGMTFTRTQHPELGEVYCMNNPRGPIACFELYISAASIGVAARQALGILQTHDGRACGWEAYEMARIESGLPRFGVDMDPTNLPPEAGLDARAISYDKGCYIGQEVIARIRTYGQVAKTLRGLRLPDVMDHLPVKGDKLVHAGKEVGYITSATRSLRFGGNLGLGYVRRECNALGTEMEVLTNSGHVPICVVSLPLSESPKP